jgi:hypothetical protein
MNDIPTTFNQMVEERFRYLVDEYGFRIIKIGTGFQHTTTAEGYVEYESATSFVTVTGEWYWNGITLGHSQDDRRFALSTGLIYEYMSLTPEEREIICSQDPRDNRTAARLIVSKILQHEKKQSASKAEEINSQLSEHAQWLKQYAAPFLRGDFSQWLEIYEYKVSKMIGELKRSGRNEYCLRFVRNDENGKPVYVQEHAFSKSLDYLARLRTEANPE